MKKENEHLNTSLQHTASVENSLVTVIPPFRVNYQAEENLSADLPNGKDDEAPCLEDEILSSFDDYFDEEGEIITSSKGVDCSGDYDEWSNFENGSSLPEELKAPHDSAANTDHEANQTTCTRGSKMYANSITAPVGGVVPTPNIHHSMITRINQTYLGDSLKDAVARFSTVLAKSFQGTGKTYAVKVLIKADDGDVIKAGDNKVLMISPREKLNRALANEMGFSYYADIKKAIKQNQSPDLIIPMIERMTCTPQSLPALARYYKEKTGADLAYNVIVLDEIEAIAEMLTSNVTQHKTEALSVFKDIAHRSGVRVGLDAFPTEKSRYLLGLLSPTGSFGDLVNAHKRWSNIKANIIEGGSYSKRAEALTTLMREAIKQGKRVAITSSSAVFCKRAYETLTALHPDLRFIMVDREGSPEATALMDNTDLITNYDVIIYTPTINVGVSFDIENHVDCVFAAFPNAEGTGGTSDALQALARVRHPVDNEWFVALDEPKALFNIDRSALASDEVCTILMNRYQKERFGAGVVGEVSAVEEEVLRLWSINDRDRILDKNNFNSLFKHKLEAMGVSVARLPIESIGTDAELSNTIEEVKESLEALEVAAKTKSERIDERQYNHITMRLKHDKQSVTKSERDSVKRYKFESKFNINCDLLTSSELDDYLELDSNNAISQVINREIVLGATAAFNNRLMKARTIGLGENGAFKVDLVDEKLNYRMKARLLSYALPYLDGESYSHNSLIKSNLYRFIKDHEKEILVSRVIPLASDWSKKPALIMNHLLTMCGYKVTAERKVVPATKRSKAKKVRVWRAISDKAIDALVADRLDRGENWVHKTTTLMDIYEDMKCFLTPEMIEELQMPRVDINFVHDQLKLIPSNLKAGILAEYVERYDMMNPDNRLGVDAPLVANKWLSEQVAGFAKLPDVLQA